MKKKLVLLISLTMSSLFANDIYDGLTVFENHCISCHIMATKDDVGGHNHGKDIIAPPAHRVHEKMREKFPNKTEFDVFVIDYIQFPSEEKAICKGAVKKFGLMPAIGLGMSNDEKKIVSEYLYNLTIEDINRYQNK